MWDPICVECERKICRISAWTQEPPRFAMSGILGFTMYVGYSGRIHMLSPLKCIPKFWVYAGYIMHDYITLPLANLEI